MPSLASDRVALGIFAALLAGSVGLKVLKGPEVRQPLQSAPGLIEEGIVENLRSRGFSTKLQPTRLHGTIVLAARGGCRLSVRDGSLGEWEMGIYARDAAPIGPVRFVMSGKSYDSPPSLPILAGRLRARIVKGLGLNGTAPVALALAASPACGTRDFGLSRTQVPV